MRATKPTPRTAVPAVAVLILSASLLAACSSGPDTAALTPPVDAKLVAYDSCDDALAKLRAAITPHIGAYGIELGGPHAFNSADGATDKSAPGAAAPGAAPESANGAAADPYSGTNVQEAGIDEPDTVKTDGKRILALRDSTLRVVDAATHALVKDIPLADPGSEDGAYFTGTSMLLAGDRVLVISQNNGYVAYGPVDDKGVPGTGELRLALVDLNAGAVTERFAFTGTSVDARLYGSTVRLVASSAPQLRFPGPVDGESPGDGMARNRRAVAESTIADWLPRYTHTGPDGAVNEGTVGCESMRHAFEYSATSMLTVLTFDLNAAMGTGSPVTIVADGQTVYGSPSALYVANDRRAFTMEAPAPTTELYRFDVSNPGPPVYASSGTIPGYVLNQYSMSEYQGYLRVATTSDPPYGSKSAKSHSGVYVLKQDGDALNQVGMVDGLGKGEQIYAVRFVGPTAYVVTFRQTDPLYVVDLSAPAAPAVAGELKITGYSAYLHPIGADRLIGVGQEATTSGRTTGTQVSLFDVSNPAAPGKLGEYEVPGTMSQVQYDPHAFLYWEATRTLVVPIGPGWGLRDGGRDETGGALLLRVGETGLTRIGVVTHDAADVYTGTITRSLVIGETLWTYSNAGLKATDLTGSTQVAWIAG